MARMMTCWSEWKRFPRRESSDPIVAPVSPGLYEVRQVRSGALFAFGASGNVARALAELADQPRSFGAWFTRKAPEQLPDLEYRVCATANIEDAKTIAHGMMGRRDVYLSGAA